MISKTLYYSSFEAWLKEVVGEDPRLSFMLDGYTEEAEEWFQWYLSGLRPLEAVRRNIELYA